MKSSFRFLAFLALLPCFSKSLGSVEKCEDGSIRIHAVGSSAPVYGAEDDTQCVDLCIPANVMQFFPGVAEGGCVDQGFSTLLEAGKEFQPQGSPSPLSVNVYAAEADQSNNPDESTTEEPTGTDSNPAIFGEPCVDCEEYVALDGKTKLERIWSKVMAYEYDELPTNWLHSRPVTPGDGIDVFPNKERVNMIFDRVSDERPPNFPRMLHEYGSIAKVAFVPSSTAHPFTGFYNEGNENGIIRITFCAPIDGAKIGTRVVLAFAAKFFRDGIHSSNVPTCEGPNADPSRSPENFSVFRHLVHTSTTIPPPIDDFFAFAQNQTGTLSIADNTWFWKNGTTVEDPVAPLIIHFFPNEALNTKDAYEEDFRLELPEIPVDSVLYTAFTPVDDDGNPTICICYETDEGDVPCFTRETLQAKCNLQELGSLVSKSQFVHSEYGDNGILFKHYRACQEERKYCQYNSPLSYEDSTFTASSQPSGTCVSRRRVENYEECPAFDDEQATDSIRSYCSSEDEFEKEKMCPFAKMLHPAFSSSGEAYPIAPDDHLVSCSVDPLTTSTARTTTQDFALVRKGCCRTMNEYFATDNEESDERGRQALCSDVECRGVFESAFAGVALDCSEVEDLEVCAFEINAGPSTIPVNIGFVTAECCEAAKVHSDMAATDRVTALKDICEDGTTCIDAYEPLFLQAQVFSSDPSNRTLTETCSSMMTAGGEDVGVPAPSPTPASSASIVLPSVLVASIVLVGSVI